MIATPPLSVTSRYLAWRQLQRVERPRETMMVVDVRKAFLNSTIKRHVNGHLAQEDDVVKDAKWMGRVKKAV